MPAQINGRDMTDDEMIADGRRRLDRIRDSIRQHRQLNHGAYTTPPTLLPLYHAVLASATKPGISAGIATMLHRHGEPDHGYILVEVNNTRPDAKSLSPYQNYVQEDGRVIMCMSNYRSLDTTPKSQLMKWADILAASCVEALHAVGRNADTMVALSSIWRISIANTQTEQLIDKLKARYRSTGAPIDVRPDDLFFALLASDHGRGTASLLAAYPWMFGFKTIVSATIIPTDVLPSLYWRLEPVVEDLPAPERPRPDAPGSSPMSRKQRRKHNKTMSKESNKSTDEQ